VLIGLGIDLVAVSRVEEELASDADDFKRRLFTPTEIAYCDGQR
jgi:phosphopantetheinyl transferase (holo-ACP synthase)